MNDRAPSPLDSFLAMLEERVGIKLPIPPAPDTSTVNPANPTTTNPAKYNVSAIAAERETFRVRQKEKRLNGVNLYKSRTSPLPSIFARFNEEENDPITKQ
jgi:hypothetical protein